MKQQEERYPTVSELNGQLTQPPVATAEMMIRKPVAAVFQAFVDPSVTSRFWFTGGSGMLEPGATVRWDWKMYDFSTQATVIEFEPDRRIRIDWATGDIPTEVEWRFTPRPDDTTLVSITNSGFQGNADERVAQAIGSTEGFAFVLAGAKAWLEHNVALNLVADRFPDGLGGNS